jgi:hypothetical protein
MCSGGSGGGPSGPSAPSAAPAFSLPNVLYGFPTVLVFSFYAVILMITIAFSYNSKSS